MKTSSRKAKGRALQDYITHQLRGRFCVSDDSNEKGFPKDSDIQPAIMGESGVDIKLYGLAKEVFPFDIEAKNQETWSIPSWWKQTTTNTEEGRKPLLVIKKNRHEPLVVLRWEDFKELI